MARILTTTAYTAQLQRLIVALVVALAFLAGSLVGAFAPDLLNRASAAGRTEIGAIAAARTGLNTPIQAAASSAYDGQSGRAWRPATVQSARSPIHTAASSAYNGQPVVYHRSPMNSTPTLSAGSSAYDGQPTR